MNTTHTKRIPQTQAVHILSKRSLSHVYSDTALMCCTGHCDIMTSCCSALHTANRHKAV